MLDLESQRYGLAATLLGIGSLAALWRFLARLRRSRLVADTPLVRVRSAAQGYVKVVGRATSAGSEQMIAPLSARPCVWWEYTIAEEVQDSRGNKRWDTVERASSVELFALTDGDAQCLVGPVRAEITPTASNVWYGSSSRPAGPPPERPQQFHSGGWRYTENLIAQGALVSVMGELRSHSEVGDSSRATLEKLREWKKDQSGLLLKFDKNHDGKIDSVEWEAVRDAARTESGSQTLRSPISRTSVISEPTDGSPFLIAPQSVKQLAARERHVAAAFLVVAVACIVACAWAFSRARLLAAIGS